MKQLPIYVFALMFQFVGLSAAILDVDSQIDSVTVYQGSARVTRTFEVDMKAGESATLRFVGLPSSVNGYFVSVGVTEGAALDFGVVSISNQYEYEDRSQTIMDLEARVREIQARKALLEADKLAVNHYAQSRANLVVTINRGLAETGKPELYELSKTAYADAELAAKDAFEKSAGIDENLRRVGEELSTANEAVRKQQEKELATCAKYAVEAISSGGKTKGTIIYDVEDVAWSPAYIVKADTTAGNVDISYLCNVSQNTGEDWNDVALYLETSKPGSGAEPDELRPVYIRHFEKSGNSFGKTSDSGAIEAFTMKVDMAAPMEMKRTSGSGINEVTTSFTGFRAAVNGRVTIRSSNGETMLPLDSRTMPCEFHTETIPLTGEMAFLIGKLKNGFELPMLTGVMQVIVDGSTNGTGEMKETLPNDEVTVGLGVNQNVIVERRTLADKGGAGGLFGGKRVEERSYTTKITNHMKVPARVIMRDRVPISKDDKIVVELNKPEGAKIDPEKGTFDTEVTIQPGQSVELPTLFKVSYPSDWQVTNF